MPSSQVKRVVITSASTLLWLGLEGLSLELYCGGVVREFWPLDRLVSFYKGYNIFLRPFLDQYRSACFARSTFFRLGAQRVTVLQ